MSTPNPLKETQSTPPPPVSVKTFHIAGILTDVYGLDELPQTCKSVSCLWLLHGRLQSKEVMAGVASACINDWKLRRPSGNEVGLLAIAFDQRNHGSRLINALANEAWKGGNETHAQDMFSVYHGTALDTSFLIDHLGSYVLSGPNAPHIDQHLILGISLGGHAAWQAFFNDPRVTAAIVIIGCPDYMRLMSDRARLSKRETYTTSNGAGFFGSNDFPKALISSIQKSDPKGMLFGTSEIQSNPPESEQRRFREIFDTKIKGKRLLVCSGADDKLVPYHCAEPFMQFLKEATSTWYKDGNVYVEDNVYPGVGHAYSPDMLRDTTRFVSDILAGSSSIGGKGASKM